jgi:hypothetical protein
MRIPSFKEYLLTEAPVTDIAVKHLCRLFTTAMHTAREREIDRDIAKGRHFPWSEGMTKAAIKARLMSMNDEVMTPKVGQKFIALDLVQSNGGTTGGSGAFLADKETGIIYGIKAYRQVHPNYTFGTVTDPHISAMVLRIRPQLSPFLHESHTLALTTNVPPPEMESWMKKNKSSYVKQHGEEVGMSMLTAAAWDKHNREKSERDSSMTEEAGDDVRMALAQMKSIIDRATAAHNAIESTGVMELPAWVQSKITEADSCVVTVHDYLMYSPSEN